MQFILLKTDGGPHPPEVWAAATARGVIDIAATAEEGLAREARELEQKVIAVLSRHHGLAQSHERRQLEVRGIDRLATNVDTTAHVPDAVDDIIALAKGTSFEAHFNQQAKDVPATNADGGPVLDPETGKQVMYRAPSTREYLERLIHEHMHEIMVIERSYRADRQMDHPIARAFKAAQTHGIALLTQTDDEHEDKGGRELVHEMVRSLHPHMTAFEEPEQPAEDR